MPPVAVQQLLRPAAAAAVVLQRRSSAAPLHRSLTARAPALAARALTVVAAVSGSSAEQQPVQEAARKGRGHQAPAPMAAPDAAVVRLREHQSAAPRQTFPDECRTLVHVGRYGVISTISKEHDGAPSGSVVGFASDAAGKPIFVFSTMSGHTRDVMEDPRCALTVVASDFKGAADARVTLNGRAVLSRVPEAELPVARSAYLGKHPDAFWVDFGDFSYWRMDEIKSIRLVGGFARAGSVPPHLYAAAAPDPVAGECAELIARWNAAAPEAPAAWVRHYVGDVGVSRAAIASLDRLGLNLAARRDNGDAYKLRLPFPAAADSVEAVEAQLNRMQHESQR